MEARSCEEDGACRVWPSPRGSLRRRPHMASRRRPHPPRPRSCRLRWPFHRDSRSCPRRKETASWPSVLFLVSFCFFSRNLQLLVAGNGLCCLGRRTRHFPCSSTASGVSFLVTEQDAVFPYECPSCRLPRCLVYLYLISLSFKHSSSGRVCLSFSIFHYPRSRTAEALKEESALSVPSSTFAPFFPSPSCALPPAQEPPLSQPFLSR